MDDEIEQVTSVLNLDLTKTHQKSFFDSYKWRGIKKKSYKSVKIASILATFILLGLMSKDELKPPPGESPMVSDASTMETTRICSGSSGSLIQLNPINRNDDLLYKCSIMNRKSLVTPVSPTFLFYNKHKWIAQWSQTEASAFASWMDSNGFYVSCYRHIKPCLLYESSISFCLSDRGKLVGITFLHRNISLDEVSSYNFVSAFQLLTNKVV